MARLFITQREIDFINDIAKEVIKDVVGQRIFYYSVSREKSRIHDVYDEAIEKIFENPLEINALVDWQASEVHATEFGTEQLRTISVFIPARDMIDREIVLQGGDFVSYGSQFFEVVKVVAMRSIYGQVEHSDGIELMCREARQSLFVTKVLGPTGESFSDDDAVQKKFVQQRGLTSNAEGPTGDVRALQERGVLQKPLSGVREVSERGDDKGSSGFYHEDC